MGNLDNITRLQELYGQEFNMQDVITLEDQNGNPFLWVSTKMRDVSALEGGYIITPKGQFLPVHDFQEHDDVFSMYINYYTGNPASTQQWGSSECTKILNDLGHIVYFGVKKRYIGEITTGNETQNYLRDEKISSMAKGYGVLSFPYDENIQNGQKKPEGAESKITNEQKLATELLLITNHKGTNKRYAKALDISYGNMEMAQEYDHQSRLELFQPDPNEGLNISKEDLDYVIDCFHKIVLINAASLNRVKNELAEYEENTNMEEKEILRDLFLNIQSSKLSTSHKAKEFAEIIRVAKSYNDDPTVLGYTQGKYDELKLSHEKLFFKLNRYQNWVEYLQKIRENKVNYPNKK